MAAKQNIRFGLIGCGLMGRYFAIATKQWGMLRGSLPTPEIVGACDLQPANLAWFESNVETLREPTADYRALLAREDIDAIYCAVPHHLHADIYVDTIQAGKHLMAEKPFGIDLASIPAPNASRRRREKVGSAP